MAKLFMAQVHVACRTAEGHFHKCGGYTRVEVWQAAHASNAASTMMMVVVSQACVQI